MEAKTPDLPGPALSGPDYFSIVIEWELAEEAAPIEELDDQVTGRQIRHWDEVDEASAESFPASDPPAWGSSHAAPSHETAAAMTGDVEAPAGIARTTRARSPSWLERHPVVASVAALATLLASMRRRRHRRVL